MIIKFLLAIPLLIMMLYVLLQRLSSNTLRWIMFSALATGIYFIWFPDSANALAKAVGVGRGADLLIYVWILITLGILLMLYLRLVRLQRSITKLARHITLAHPYHLSQRGKDDVSHEA